VEKENPNVMLLKKSTQKKNSHFLLNVKIYDKSN
jgi:hypothetical protein